MLLQSSKGNHIYLIRRRNYFTKLLLHYSPPFRIKDKILHHQVSLEKKPTELRASTASYGLDADFREAQAASAVWKFKPFIFIWTYSILTSKGLKILVKAQKKGAS